jgi:mRNA interferase MazF
MNGSDLRPKRGDVWLANLDPVLGHEQGGQRPVLVVSVDAFQNGPSGLVTVVALTTRDWGVLAHIRVNPPEGGLTRPSFILCDQMRTITQHRLRRRMGVVVPSTMVEVEYWLRTFLGL